MRFYGKLRNQLKRAYLWKIYKNMNIFNKIKIGQINIKYITLAVISVIFIGLLLIFTKGDKGNPLDFQTQQDTRIEGPFELSNTTARYALTEAIFERGTFFLTQDEAKFSAPDVVDYNGRFISIFTPGMSLLGLPLYFVGRIFGLPQIFTFLTIAIVAFINIFLVAKIASKLGAGLYTAILSGFTFVFATNALGYTLTFTQHQTSTMLILLAILNAFGERNWKNNVLFGMIFGAGALADIPNTILMMPIGLYILAKHVGVYEIEQKVKISLKTAGLGLVLGVAPLIILFAFYNYSTTGSFIKIAQDIGRTKFFRTTLPVQNPADSYQPDTRGNPIINIPFATRNMLNGFYILGISNERSWLYYSPILFVGLLGFVLIYKSNPEKRSALNVLISVVALNFILYSMLDDPWGGWAFGSRYLIPAAGITASGIGVVLERYKRNSPVIIIFFILLAYSITVSSLGAITTNAVAPKVEAVNLKPAIPYTYEYNINFINKNQSGNLLYNLELKNVLPLRLYWYILSGAIIGIGVLIYLLCLLEKEKNNV